MRTIGFIRNTVVGSSDDRVKVQATTILNMPDEHARAVKLMTSAACDLTPSRLSEAMFGEPYVPQRLVR